MNEVSRDLIVNSYSKKKQALLVFLSLCVLFVYKLALVSCNAFSRFLTILFHYAENWFFGIHNWAYKVV